MSSHNQKPDLERQVQTLTLYCQQQGWGDIEIIQDLGSGLNYKKKGLTRLINLLLEDKVERLVITHKDRLLRFGSELIFSLWEQVGSQVIIVNSKEDTIFAEELANDILEIITVFSARLYVSGSRKNLKLMQKLQEIPQELSEKCG